MHPADSNYTITLNSSRNINLEETHQHLTYLGLLEGLPNKRINDSIMSEIHNIADDKIWTNTPPYIIEPKLTSIDLPRDRMEYYKSKGPDYEPIALPKIICMGHFSSGAITEEYMFSSLTVVWFQKDWMMPIDGNILTQIKSLNWDELAVQGDY